MFVCIKKKFTVPVSGSHSFTLVAATRDSKHVKEAKFWRDYGQEDGKE